jgi:hypothetical protein
VAAQKIVAGADGEAHEPVFKRSVAPKAGEFLEGFHPDFLNDVFNFGFAAGVAAGGGEDARGIFDDERLEAGGVAGEDGGD